MGPAPLCSASLHRIRPTFAQRRSETKMVPGNGWDLHYSSFIIHEEATPNRYENGKHWNMYEDVSACTKYLSSNSLHGFTLFSASFWGWLCISRSFEKERNKKKWPGLTGYLEDPMILAISCDGAIWGSSCGELLPLFVAHPHPHPHPHAPFWFVFFSMVIPRYPQCWLRPPPRMVKSPWAPLVRSCLGVVRFCAQGRCVNVAAMAWWWWFVSMRLRFHHLKRRSDLTDLPSRPNMGFPFRHRATPSHHPFYWDFPYFGYPHDYGNLHISLFCLEDTLPVDRESWNILPGPVRKPWCRRWQHPTEHPFSTCNLFVFSISFSYIFSHL